MAAWFLSTRGLKILQTNLDLEGGEIDVLARDRRDLVAVEVRSRSGGADPIDAVGHTKRARVRRLASSIGATRVDFLGVRITDDGVDFHWVTS